MKIALTVLATLAGVALLALLFPYTGIFNVSAAAGDSAFTKWYLNTISTRSIKVRANDITVPGDLTSAEKVARGAVAFSQMCQTCHGAPGKDPSVTGQGMTPEPPRLSEAATEWEPNEIYWILENGIKMAGMPAYGPTHSDEELWEIVAFVEQLPGMTQERYDTLTTPAEAATADSVTAPRAHDGHDHVH